MTGLTCSESMADILLSLKIPQVSLVDPLKTKSLKQNSLCFSRESHKKKQRQHINMRYRTYRICFSKTFATTQTIFDLPFVPFHVAAEKISAEDRKNAKVFFCATQMQSVFLTEFWMHNYGQTPNPKQLKWLSEMTQLDQEGVLRWFAYRNSKSYRQRVMVQQNIKNNKLRQWILAWSHQNQYDHDEEEEEQNMKVIL